MGRALAMGTAIDLRREVGSGDAVPCPVAAGRALGPAPPHRGPRGRARREHPPQRWQHHERRSRGRGRARPCARRRRPGPGGDAPAPARCARSPAGGDDSAPRRGEHHLPPWLAGHRLASGAAALLRRDRGRGALARRVLDQRRCDPPVAAQHVRIGRPGHPPVEHRPARPAGPDPRRASALGAAGSGRLRSTQDLGGSRGRLRRTAGRPAEESQGGSGSIRVRSPPSPPATDGDWPTSPAPRRRRSTGASSKGGP